MSENLIAHNVYFELYDTSDKAVEKMITDCHKYLKPIPGIVYFSAGIIHSGHNRGVNARDFQVGTHVTFCDQASHDNYQCCALHDAFVDRNKQNWKSVRVYDFIPEYFS